MWFLFVVWSSMSAHGYEMDKAQVMSSFGSEAECSAAAAAMKKGQFGVQKSSVMSPVCMQDSVAVHLKANGNFVMKDDVGV